MAARLNPYLTFDGNARAAMEFYNQVLGGTLTLNTFGEMGAQGTPDDDKIMHALLETDRGFVLMASDMPPGMEHSAGNNMSVSLSGDENDGLGDYWAKLSEGGDVSVPLEKQMWGDEFGMCTDRFGVPWMVNITSAQA